MDALIVIPARWGSSRLPGKPLAMLAGQTLLQRTAANARCAAAHRDGVSVVVTTDHQGVADHARSLGHEVVMSDPAIANGTERALAAARAQSTPPSLIVSLQVDTPFTSPATLIAVLDAVAGGAPVATPIVTLDWAALDALRAHKVESPFSGTTCVPRKDGRALWFSKAIIPAIRDEPRLRQTSALSPVHRHIGLYGYARSALEAFCALPPSRLERIEQLEQLRFLEADIPIQTVPIPPHRWLMNGIDTPADLAAAHRLLHRHGEPDWT